MDKFWQFRNMEVNKLFAVHSHENSQRMERLNTDMHQSTINMETATYSMHTIADKTEKKTASMHIITFVTLVFLPGTFVAVSCLLLLLLLMSGVSEELLMSSPGQTFFGSGLFQWPDGQQGVPGVALPVWKPEFFKLFLMISCPMMGLTIIIWLVAYFLARRRTALRKEADVEEGERDDGEKSRKFWRCSGEVQEKRMGWACCGLLEAFTVKS
jgi:hypothetical protein